MSGIIQESSLPSLNSRGWDPTSDLYCAYARVLEEEAYATQELGRARSVHSSKGRSAAIKEAKGNLVSVRVVGFTLLEFSDHHSSVLGVEPSIKLVSWLLSGAAGSDEIARRKIIIGVGILLRDKFIRPFRTSNTPYPPPSLHPSRPSFDSLENMIKESLECTEKDYRSLRQKALARDRFSCVVTGLFDSSSIVRSPELWNQGTPEAPLQVAHIFNESMMQHIDPDVDEDVESRVLNKTRTTAGALAILEWFGFKAIVDAFKQEGGVHETWNLVTLETSPHAWFDSLQLWFEYTEQRHRYKICVLRRSQEGFIRRFCGGDNTAPMFVEFNTRHEEAQPPDPLLLTLHAICARVAHMSGAAEFFDEIHRDAEETKTLASDGSAAILLSNLLSPLAIHPGVGAYEDVPTVDPLLKKAGAGR